MILNARCILLHGKLTHETISPFSRWKSKTLDRSTRELKGGPHSFHSEKIQPESNPVHLRKPYSVLILWHPEARDGPPDNWLGKRDVESSACGTPYTPSSPGWSLKEVLIDPWNVHTSHAFICPNNFKGFHYHRFAVLLCNSNRKHSSSIRKHIDRSYSCRSLGG